MPPLCNETEASSNGSPLNSDSVNDANYSFSSLSNYSTKPTHKPPHKTNIYNAIDHIDMADELSYDLNDNVAHDSAVF